MVVLRSLWRLTEVLCSVESGALMGQPWLQVRRSSLVFRLMIIYWLSFYDTCNISIINVQSFTFSVLSWILVYFQTMNIKMFSVNSFIFMQMKLIFKWKGFTRGLILKQGHKATQKWPTGIAWWAKFHKVDVSPNYWAQVAKVTCTYSMYKIKRL